VGTIVSKRVRLPTDRQAVTRHTTIRPVGQPDCDVYVTVGLYEDGRPAEIFVRVSAIDSDLYNWIEAWATLASVALQHGVPLSEIVGKGRHTKGGPAGRTTDARAQTCTSPLDYVCAWLQWRF
jgi:ribonucleoside-diphosphate reductase alpha chain